MASVVLVGSRGWTVQRYMLAVLVGQSNSRDESGSRMRQRVTHNDMQPVSAPCATACSVSEHGT
jgi:hypothetical protein